MHKQTLFATLLLFILAAGTFGQSPVMPSQSRDAEKDASGDC